MPPPPVLLCTHVTSQIGSVLKRFPLHVVRAARLPCGS